MESYKAQLITSAQAHAVRHPVLRPGRPFETAIFPEDDLKETFHVGVLSEQNPVGTVTLLKNSNPQFKAVHQYQLRGMAVLDTHQRKGLGELMVKKAEEEMKKRGGRFVWLNAREVAVKFYEKMGYTVHGDEFMVAGIGLHYVMFKELKS